MQGGKGRRGATLSLIGRDPDAAYYSAEALRRGGPVLVLGSADGRIAWELAAGGARVIAVDPSTVMIGTAESRRASEPLEVSERLRFQASDLRVLRLSEKFPLVVAPQNALGLMSSLEDLEALLATVHHHLHPGGAFLFDVHHPPEPPALTAPLRDEAPDAPTGPLEPKRPVFTPHLRERRRDGEKQSGAIRRLKLRPFTPDEVDTALAGSGFLALERYGGFDGTPFEPSSPVQVVLAVLDTRPSLQ